MTVKSVPNWNHQSDSIPFFSLLFREESFKSPCFYATLCIIKHLWCCLYTCYNTTFEFWQLPFLFLINSGLQRTRGQCDGWAWVASVLLGLILSEY